MEVARAQLTALVDQLRSNQDVSLRGDIAKLKKEISEKERHINSLNSTIEKLKSGNIGNVGNIGFESKSITRSNCKI